MLVVLKDENRIIFKLVVMLIACVILCVQPFFVSANTASAEVISYPQNGDIVSEDNLTCNVYIPSGVYESNLYIDGEKITAFTNSGQSSFSADISKLLNGRHILTLEMQYADNRIVEKKFFYKATTPVSRITEFSIVSGGEIISVTDENTLNENVREICLSLVEGATVSPDNIELSYVFGDKKTPVLADVSVEDEHITVKIESPLQGGYIHVLEIGDVKIENDIIDDMCVCFNVSKSECKVYKYASFESETGLSVSTVGGGDIILSKDGEKRVLQFSSLKGTSYVDVLCTNILDANEYVIDVMLKLNAINASSSIKLFDSKTSDGSSWWFGTKVLNNGTIVTNEGEYISDFETNKWFRYSVIYNILNGAYSVYIDGELKKGNIVSQKWIAEGSSNIIRPTCFRIDADNRHGAGELDFCIDDLKVYSGNKIIDSIVDKPFEATSVMDKSSYTKELISNASVYMLYNDYYFADGVKRKHKSDRPMLKEDNVFVTTDFVQSVMGYKATANGSEITIGNSAKFQINSALASVGEESIELKAMPFEENEKIYIPLEDLAGIINKEFLYDSRGFVILSDEKFPYIDGEHFRNVFEASDYIYRYMQFDNPCGEEIYMDYTEGENFGCHPRILYTNDDIEFIKNKSKTDSIWAVYVEGARESADNIVKNCRDDILIADCTDSSKQGQAVTFQSIMQTLAEGYLLTGNEEYAEKAMTYMRTMSEWENLAVKTSNLITGHYAMGMAIGFDTFYEYMNKTDVGREAIKQIKSAVSRMPFADTINAYKGRGDAHWITIADNFQGAISGGILALALSVLDEEDMQEDAKYIIENVLKSQQIAVSLYGPDGGYFEGVGYSEYMLTNLSMGIEALFNCCKTDYGLGSAKGFSDAGAFFVYMQGKVNMLNFHDSDRSFSNSFLPCWFAYRYGKTSYAEEYLTQIKKRGQGISLRGLLYYDRAEKSSNEQLPVDKYFAGADSGTFRNMFNTDTPTFVGFHGGWTNLLHDMLDLGEFVFEAQGVPWVIDLGKDDYNLSEYFGKNGYRLYRKRTEGENCVVINPKNLYTDSSGQEEYYGQKLDERAELVDFVSKDKGAYAIYNLTNAYQRDVNSYKRGYYFGDNRNTLLVQDEIKLKEASEVYWFMHTPAEIEIVDKNTAVLSYGGKELNIQVFCSTPNFELLDMPAKPLDSSPNVSGQNQNEGIKKLAIHVENATGDIAIAVKLIPESDFFDAEALEYKKMDLWEIPSGDISYKPMVYDVYLSTDKHLGYNLQVPFDTKKVKVYIDDVLKDSFVPRNFGLLTENRLDLNDIEGGSHKLKIIFEADGKSYEVEKQFIACKFDNSVRYENTLEDYDGKAVYDENGWCFKAVGESIDSDDGFTLAGTGSRYLDYRVVGDLKQNSINHGVLEVECDVKFSRTHGHFEFECYNEDVKWYAYDIKAFNNGKILNGENYNANEWYKIKLSVDLENHKLSFYVNDKPVLLGVNVDFAKSIMCIKLQYWSDVNGDAVSYKNFKVIHRVNLYDGGYLMLDVDASKTTATANYVNLTNGMKDAMLILAVYENDRLLSIKLPTISEALSGEEVPDNKISIPKNATKVVAFVWERLSRLKPLMSEKSVDLGTLQ